MELDSSSYPLGSFPILPLIGELVCCAPCCAMPEGERLAMYRMHRKASEGGQAVGLGNKESCGDG